MSKDISKVLNDWEYEPDQVSVRIVTGDDGEEKIQLRLDLGLLQMQLHGRPDGVRPEGCESWLEYYETQQAQAGEGFELSSEDCSRLLREGLQYYHRYLSFWNLSRYDLCARDTERNLRLFAFVRAHAKDDREKLQFDQWRPYVTMMHTRAVATPYLDAENYTAALRAIDQGIRQIRRFLDEYRQSNRNKQCAELTFLERWRKEVRSLKSKSKPDDAEDLLDRLREQLTRAVAAEKFEEAARLRDEIRRVGSEAGP